MQLADDTTVLVKERRTRRPTFCRPQVPVCDPDMRSIPRRSVPQIRGNSRGIILEANPFFMSLRMVNGNRAGGVRPAAVPSAPKGVDTRSHVFIQLEKSHI